MVVPQPRESFQRRVFCFMREILLPRGRLTLVDDEDYPWLNEYPWRCVPSGYVMRLFYVGGITKAAYMHRVIMNCPIGMDVDHRDRNPLNNQKSNLRVVTDSQNLHNSKIQTRGGRKTSRYKGVVWDREKRRWRAEIRVNKRCIYIGRFLAEIDAAAAYNRSAIAYYGDVALVNPI